MAVEGTVTGGSLTLGVEVTGPLVGLACRKAGLLNRDEELPRRHGLRHERRAASRDPFEVERLGRVPGQEHDADVRIPIHDHSASSMPDMCGMMTSVTRTSIGSSSSASRVMASAPSATAITS